MSGRSCRAVREMAASASSAGAGVSCPWAEVGSSFSIPRPTCSGRQRRRDVSGSAPCLPEELVHRQPSVNVPRLRWARGGVPGTCASLETLASGGLSCAHLGFGFLLVALAWLAVHVFPVLPLAAPPLAAAGLGDQFSPSHPGPGSPSCCSALPGGGELGGETPPLNPRSSSASATREP